MRRKTVLRVLAAMTLVALLYLVMYARHGIVLRQDRVHAAHVQVAREVTKLRAVCERLLFANWIGGSNPGAARDRLERHLDTGRTLLPEPQLRSPLDPQPGAAFRELDESPLPDVTRLAVLADSIQVAAMEMIAFTAPTQEDAEADLEGLRFPVRERYAAVVARAAQYRALRRELDAHLSRPFVSTVASIFGLRSRHEPPVAARTEG